MGNGFLDTYLRSRGLRRRPGRSYHVESLESRQLLAADVMITEFVADNEKGLRDNFGERVDWIELYNAGDQAADLSGWFLTDDPANLQKWRFPTQSVEPERFLLVYASGKDQAASDQPLHTNFRLSRDGDYLALVRPNGTIKQEFRPTYPALPSDISLGVSHRANDSLLAGQGTSAKLFVPTSTNGAEAIGMDWIQPGFDDSQWISSTTDIGFDQRDDFTAYYTTNVSDVMFRTSSGIFVRSAFQLDLPDRVFSLALRMRYDDGFVAYLNGVEIARANAPDELRWDARSSGSRDNLEAIAWQTYDLSEFVPLLRDGENVFAVFALNGSTSNSDFLMVPDLRLVQPGEVLDTTPRFLAEPSPAWPNGTSSYAGVILLPDVQPARGFYTQPIDVQLHSPVPDVRLVYTLDGSEPTLEHGTVLTTTADESGVRGQLRIDRTTTLRVAGYRDDYLTMGVATHTYLFPQDIGQQTFDATVAAGFPAMWRGTAADYGLDPDVIGPDDKFDGEFAAQFVDSLLAVPSVSLVLDQEALFSEESGLYLNPTRAGGAWERATSVEWIDPAGELGFQVDAGLRIQGGASREHSNSKKKSLRLEFRGEYGPTELEQALFGADATDRFDTLILRANYNDSWVHTPDRTQYIRDEWMRRSQLAMGQPSPHGRFVQVYINGFYWGLYNMVERPEASFAASYYGGNDDDWDAVNTDTAVDGESDIWRSLRGVVRDIDEDDQAAGNVIVNQIMGRGPTGEPSEMEVLIDLENYIDYMILNFYGGNTDWPHKNFYVARRRGPDSEGFQFFSWDAEKVLDHGEGSTLTVDQTGERDGVAIPFNWLKESAEFRMMFADRVQQHLFHGGALYVDPENPAWDPAHPERNLPAARYAELADEVELALVAEMARWGDEKGSETPFGLIEWRRMRDNILERYLPQRGAIVLDHFRAAGLYPTVDAPRFAQHGGTVAGGYQLTINGPGTVYYTRDGSDPRLSPLLTGAATATVAPGAETYQGPVVIDATTVIQARSLVDGQWSALTTATFSVDQSALRISELMYHPRRTNQDAAFGEEDFEYLEVVNTSPTATLPLGGIRLVDGIEFELPQESLAPGERAVIVANQAAFRHRYGEDIRVLGQYVVHPDSPRLSNAGETLRMEDALGNVLQEFSYEDDWFSATDGDGLSLEAIDLGADAIAWSDPSQWHASLLAGGTPGLQPGDLNRDRRISVEDLNLVCTQMRGRVGAFDVTGDGAIDERDVIRLVRDAMGVAIGDANLDGRFDGQDLIAALQSGTYEDRIASNSGWASGDWNCDGEFTSRDLVVAMQAGGFVPAAAARPRADWASAVDSYWSDHEQNGKKPRS